MSIFTADDVAAVRKDRLVRVAQTYFPRVELSDDYLLGKLRSAEAETSRQLKVLLEPTTLFSSTPTPAQIAALGTMPYKVEPGYDYDPAFFDGERWGFLVTRQHPIISIASMVFAYPSPTTGFFSIPNAWMRIDLKYGHIRLVPASAAFEAPLGAFLMQALGAGLTIPSALQVQYVAGLSNVSDDWPDLVDVILKKAVLSIIEDNFMPSSGSISIDGMSRSLSIDTLKYEDLIDRKLFGPKGANGGLWTAIHGVTMSMLGVTA